MHNNISRSHFREDVTHFFECFCEVVPPTNDKSAWIIQQFPEKYKDEGVLKSVPNFAYPYKFEKYVRNDIFREYGKLTSYFF